jgi:hypothetical protein
VLLDDGTGQPRAELKPLAGYLCTQMHPRRVHNWLRKPGTRELLADLAVGRVAVSHQALAAREDWARSTYLRDLLVASGVLPPADRQLTGYEGWLHLQLARLDGHPHHTLLREFGLWHQLPRMRATAAARPLRQTACKYAQTRFLAAADFLDWLSERGLRPAGVGQADIDAFYTSRKTYQKQAIRSFLTWAITHGHVPAADVPVLRFGKGPGLTQQERLALIRRFATSGDLPLHLRVAACLMLLYAQPLARVVRLAAGDIIRDDGQVYLRFGTPPAPVPGPFAAMLVELAAAGPEPAGFSPAAMPASPGTTGPSITPCGTPACRCATRAHPRCATSSSRPPRPSSPTPSASTRPPPPGSSPRLAAPGAGTPPAAGHPDRQIGQRRSQRHHAGHGEHDAQHQPGHGRRH